MWEGATGFYRPVRPNVPVLVVAGRSRPLASTLSLREGANVAPVPLLEASSGREKNNTKRLRAADEGRRAWRMSPKGLQKVS